MYHSSSFRNAPIPPKTLQIVLVNAILNNKSYVMEVSYWITIIELKRKIEKNFGIPTGNQRLFFKAQELNQNNFSLTSFGNKKKIKIVLRPNPKIESKLGLLKQYETLPKSPAINSLLFYVQEGFNLELIPKITFEGTSGSYFLQNRYRKSVGIFKPFDEEPFTPNNPKGYIGKLGSPAFKPGVLSGESAIREVAAYLLDQVDGKSFTGVPPTTFVEVIHPFYSNKDMKDKDIMDNPMIPVQNFAQYAGGAKKVVIKHGALQQFVQGAEEASDFGPNKFPDEEVRKIAILDLRILNCDRNEGNILVLREKTGLRLIPIDHGLSFPDRFEASTYDLVWMEWPQVKKKWTPTELDYITKIDPKGDVDKLSKHFKFRDVCLRNFRIAETVLKNCALAGLTLHEIGTMMYRDDPDVQSSLEHLICKTEEFTHTMKNSMVKDLIFQLAPSIRDDSPIRRVSDNNALKINLVQDPLKDAYRSLRARSYSQEFDQNEVTPQNMLQSILDASQIDPEESPENLYAIPELQSSKSEIKKMQRQFTMNFAKPKAVLPVKYDPRTIEPEVSSSEEEDDERTSLEALSEKTLLKRSSSIPALQRKHFSYQESSHDNNEEVKPKGRLTLHHKKEKVVLPQKDELFFKYFEAFLDQEIAIMMKNKNMPVATRSRFISDY